MHTKDLRQLLSPLAFRVTQEHGTEPAFSCAFAEVWQAGRYHCVVCDVLLFDSEHQFNAGCGWPSFDAPVQADRVKQLRDTSHFMVRTEVLCASCGAHLGHVFDDGPKTTGLRYCINGVALRFEAR